MKIIDNFTLRVYFFLCLLLTNIRAWAQGDDDDLDIRPKRGADITEVFNMDEGADYSAFNLRLSDILLIALLIVACYVFGKIWKGCIYLLLAFAALMYFLSRG